QVAHAHLEELVGAEIEDVLAIGLRGVTAVAVATAELFEVVVQVAHRRLLLRGGANGASGSVFMRAICSSSAASSRIDRPVPACGRCVYFVSCACFISSRGT